jgi:hypothetical protein
MSPLYNGIPYHTHVFATCILIGISYRDVIDKIQQMEVHGKYDITANVVKGEKKGRIVILG